MADVDLVRQYRNILTAGFRAAAGDPVHPDLEDAAEDSVQASAELLAAQLERSVLDNPRLRGGILDLVSDWISQPGDLDLRDLRNSLEPLFGASRALTIARTETAGAFNGGLAAGLRAHGWTQVVWVAAPDSCDECQARDGEVMSLAQYEADPTAHPNCSCTAEPYDEAAEAEDADEGDAQEAGA